MTTTKETKHNAPDVTVQEKRLMYSVIEEGIQNPDFAGYRGGRVEVYDENDPVCQKFGYASYEARFMIPTELMEKFREFCDFAESDKPIYIDWRYPDVFGRDKD
jgi:hypothetical protein